ncbi:hypothetical protein MTO96_028418 [Rhipicephalus appendiculatus]
MNSGNLGIVEKEGINDLQTEADRSVQRCIVTSLSRQFPKLTIIGEETLEEKKISDDWIITDHDKDVLSTTLPDELKDVKEEDLVVWVDPLDGTKEYTQGFLDHVTILVGIAVQGKAVGGVIHQPYYNYQVEKDRTPPPADKRIITTTRSHSSPVINSCIESMKPDEVLRVGGAGHKVLLLIEGKAHAYVFPSKGCKKWDTCAPEAILHATGGLLTDIHGNRLQYHKDVEHVNSGGVLATCLKEQHDWFKTHIPPPTLPRHCPYHRRNPSHCLLRMQDSKVVCGLQDKKEPNVAATDEPPAKTTPLRRSLLRPRPNISTERKTAETPPLPP